jgi:hypothetical protein
MSSNEYFLKIAEHCNFNIDCANEVVSDRKKLKKVLGIENKKELDNISYDINVNFANYVFKNYKKFPKEEVAKFIVVNMCGYDFKCVLETLKENNMQNMQDYMLDYFKKNYDIENIVNEFIDEFSDEYAEDFDSDVFTLPIIAWLEFRNRPEIGLFLAMYNDEVPFALTGYFDEMESNYQYAYEEVFGEAPDNITSKINEIVDGIYSRVEDRFKQIAKNIYDETLDLINNNSTEYKIIGHEKCDSYLCYLLDTDKIPLVRVNWNEEENEEDKEDKLLNA